MRAHGIAARRATDEPSLADANERLLVRLGFDLHDGPLQQVYALAQDVRLLREQVLALVASGHAPPLAGRFDDVEAQLGSLHEDLRDLAHSLEPRSLLQQPLPEAVAHELAAFGRRTELAISFDVDGDFADATASQRIALLRVLQEALANIRQHSGAAAVAVALREPAEGGLSMEVRDDGHGFDLGSRERDADERRGLGFVGMRERLRLLGGRLEVESAPGRTVVRAVLPHYAPPG